MLSIVPLFIKITSHFTSSENQFWENCCMSHVSICGYQFLKMSLQKMILLNCLIKGLIFNADIQKIVNHRVCLFLRINFSYRNYARDNRMKFIVSFICKKPRTIRKNRSCETRLSIRINFLWDGYAKIILARRRALFYHLRLTGNLTHLAAPGRR